MTSWAFLPEPIAKQTLRRQVLRGLHFPTVKLPSSSIHSPEPLLRGAWPTVLSTPNLHCDSSPNVHTPTVVSRFPTLSSRIRQFTICPRLPGNEEILKPHLVGSRTTGPGARSLWSTVGCPIYFFSLILASGSRIRIRWHATLAESDLHTGLAAVGLPGMPVLVLFFVFLFSFRKGLGSAVRPGWLVRRTLSRGKEAGFGHRPRHIMQPSSDPLPEPQSFMVQYSPTEA